MTTLTADHHGIDEIATSQRAASTAPGSTPSKAQRWTGRVLTTLAATFLFFDASIKLVLIQPVVESSERLGYPVHTMLGIGLTLFVCTLLYVIPRSAALGAVLLTGYLGGAIATHVRVEDPLFSHTLFPAFVGTLVWSGLFLRDARLWAFFPWRHPA